MDEPKTTFTNLRVYDESARDPQRITLPVYASRTAAVEAGLKVGDFYRDATGTVKVVTPA